MRDGFGFGLLTTMAALPFVLLPFMGAPTPAGVLMLVLGGVYLSFLGIVCLSYFVAEEWRRLRARSPEQRRQDRRAWLGALSAPILIPIFAALGPFLIVGYWGWRAVSLPFRKSAVTTRSGQW